jgi:hypothetical protein
MKTKTVAWQRFLTVERQAKEALWLASRLFDRVAKLEARLKKAKK